MSIIVNDFDTANVYSVLISLASATEHLYHIEFLCVYVSFPNIVVDLPYCSVFI